MVKYRFGCTLIFLFILGWSFAQENYKRKDIVLMDEGDYLIELGDYHAALEVFEELYPLDTNYPEINYRIGRCLLNIRSREGEALRYLEKGHNGNVKEASFHLAKAYHIDQRFEQAIQLYQQYKNLEKTEFPDAEVDRFIEISERAVEMIKNPVEIYVENIGERVNTSFDEYVPLVTADESELFFTSRRPGSTGNLKDPNGQFFEDVYFSRNENGEWTQAENIGPTINTATHDATVGIAANGNFLIIYRTNEVLTGGDLFISEYSDEKWQEPIRLGDKINTIDKEASATMSVDESVLYFSSNRPGGYGGQDLYRVKKLPDGKWSLPLNLGKDINTPYDEDAPFIHPDGKTLYFSSNGHATMGGFDVFKSTLVEDGLWTAPKNLGYPINSVEDDIFFSLVASGKTAYYSSEKEEGFGGQDIYKIDLLYYKLNYTVVKGNVIDAETGAPIKARMTLIQDETNEMHGIYNSNARNGKYILIFHPEQKYKLRIEADGYVSQSDELYFGRMDFIQEVTRDVKLKKAKE